MKAGQSWRWLGRRWLVVGALAAVGLVGGACDNATVRDEAGVARPSTTQAPAREAPSTSAPPPSTPPATSAPRPDPTSVDGVPQVTVTPRRGPAGTRVRLDGDGFTGAPWKTGGGTLWLVDARAEADCLAIAEAENDLDITADGHLSGTFVVPARSRCQLNAGEGDSGPLLYEIAFQCTDCRIGPFRVILAGESMEEPAGTSCEGIVTFGVQNFADEIYADGLSCSEATAFIHDHAAPLQPPAGAAHIDAEGFSCDRTGRSDAALPPRANYKCTRGLEIIHFIRQ